MSDSSALQVRRLGKADLMAVAALQRGVMSVAFWTAEQFGDSMHARHLCLVAELGGDIAGVAVASVMADEAELLTMAVARQYQRRGVGKALLDALRTDLLERGVANCFLEVMQGNTAAIAMYRQFGFDRVGRRTGYYPTPEGRVDALVMQAALY